MPYHGDRKNIMYCCNVDGVGQSIEWEKKKKENHLVPSLETLDTFLFVSFSCLTQEKKPFFDYQDSNNEV